MGRDWYRSRSMRKERENLGCMSGVLQFFDFHATTNQASATSPSQDLSPEPVFLQGLEAPKNSLEISTEMLELQATEEKIPIGVQLLSEPTAVAAGSKGRKKEEPLEKKKTPNLVARLMGLDLLPDYDYNHNRSSDASEYRKSYGNHRNYYHNHRDHRRSQSVATTPRCSFDKFQDNQLKDVKREIQSRQPLQSRNCYVPAERRIETVKENLCHSLPDTPRISSERRSPDADPRFSVHVNKENICFTDCTSVRGSKLSSRSGFLQLNLDLETPLSPASNSFSRNRSTLKIAVEPPQRAWNKAGGTRKLGLEVGIITNHSNNTSPRCITKPTTEPGESKQPTPSCSPRLRFLSKPLGTLQDQTSTSPKTPPKPCSLKPTIPIIQSQKTKLRSQPTIKIKPNCEKFSSKLKRPSTPTLREEPFVYVSATKTTTSTEKCKTPLSNNVLNVVPPVVPVKKHNPSKTQILTDQSWTNNTKVDQKYDSREKIITTTRTSRTTSQVPCSLGQQFLHKPKSLDYQDSRGQFQYVKSILVCTGIYSSTCVSFARWYSPSHPLDPDAFHRLEATHYSSSSSTERENQQRSNRMLLFQFVDEILVNLLKPYLNMKPWAFSSNCFQNQRQKQLTGKQLLEQLCLHIQTFPSANCQFLGDIDRVVERDFHDLSNLSLSLEIENIVFEIEREITDTLLHEETLHHFQKNKI